MKKKGFTLIEMLAVILVLASLVLIIFPIIGSTIKKYREKSYNEQVNFIESAANNWLISNSSQVNKEAYMCLSISELKNSGFLKNEAIKNPLDNSDMNGYVKLTYDSSYDQYEKEYVNNCEGPFSIGETVLKAFPELELGTSGCKTLGDKNYSYMGGCYLKGGKNIKASFISNIKTDYSVDDSFINQLFNNEGNLIYSKFEELLIPMIAEDWGCTIDELKSEASSYGATELEYVFGYSEEQINTKKVEINNYLWYSGFLWRIMGINSDGTIRMITEENVTAIPYNIANNTNFEGSYVDSWLNEYFYNNLKGKDIIIANNFCQGAATTTLPSRIDCTGGTTLNRKVGLISFDEYNLANLNRSYLNNAQVVWTMSPYSSSNAWRVGSSGNASNYDVSYAFGIRAVINVNSNTTITGGNGTLSSTWTNGSSPYILNENKSTSTTGLLNNIATPGEYVKFANKTYRLVSVDSIGNTKLILDGYYQETAGTNFTMSYGTDNVFKTSAGIGQKLNTSVLDWLIPSRDTTNRNKLVTNYTWYQNNFDYGNSYTVSLNETTPTRSIEATVGLIRVGEMLSGQSYTILTKNGTVASGSDNAIDYWTMTPHTFSSNVWNVRRSGNANYDDVSFTNGVRAVINVNSKTTIIGGNGTPSNPYEI